MPAAALGLTLSMSGFVAWWLRRPAGSLGVPAVPSGASAGRGMLVLVIVLALLLDRFVFRRIGWFRTEPALAPGA